MAEAKSKKAEEAEVAAETAEVKAKPERKLPPEVVEYEGFTIRHKGHGKYGIDEHPQKEFPSLEAAQAYAVELKRSAEFANDYGDIIPEGIDVNFQGVMYRGTLIELPMNEMYLPDGSFNPHYDRAWVWGWGRVTGTDIPTKQAKGYRTVSEDELLEAVDEGTVPPHYRALLTVTDHGQHLQYADLRLMRIPRVRWRQLQAAKDDAAKARIQRTDDELAESMDRAGMKPISRGMTNEVSTGLKMSGF